MLVTTSEVSDYCNAAATEDSYLDGVRAGVEEAFKGLVGWRIEAAVYTDFLNGNGEQRVHVRQVPVFQITGTYQGVELGVWLDPVGYAGQGTGFAATTKLTAGTEYYLDIDRYGAVSQSGALVKIATTWPGGLMNRRGQLTAQRIQGVGNIKAVYAAGYTAIPDDIKLAIKEACKVIRMTRTGVGPIQSEGLGEYNYSALDMTRFREPFLRPGTLEQIVARYRRLRLQ